MTFLPYAPKGPPHTVKLNCVVYLCKKLHEKLSWLFSSTAQVSSQVCWFFFCQFPVSFIRVTVVGKNNTVVCCLLATSAIMLSENKKRTPKIWSKDWYLKRNISCDAYLLNELLESDDAIVVSAGKLRKLWDYLCKLRSSMCKRRLDKTVLKPVLLPVKTAQST
jgi:hypothetical protein